MKSKKRGVWIKTGDAVDLLDFPPQEVEDTPERRRAAFRDANASVALEGLEADEAQLARQEEVIQGRLTTEESIAQIIAKFSEK